MYCIVFLALCHILTCSLYLLHRWKGIHYHWGKKKKKNHDCTTINRATLAYSQNQWHSFELTRPGFEALFDVVSIIAQYLFEGDENKESSCFSTIQTTVLAVPCSKTQFFLPSNRRSVIIQSTLQPHCWVI